MIEVSDEGMWDSWKNVRNTAAARKKTASGSQTTNIEVTVLGSKVSGEWRYF